MRPTATAMPRPLSTTPRASRGNWLPYMKPARRDMAGPSSTFSLVASSMKPTGATMGTLRALASCAVSTPNAPPKWSTWLCVNTKPETGCAPRCWRAKARAAAAVSCVVSGSTTIQPVRPWMSVRFARSNPRSCQMPSRTWYRPGVWFRRAWRHRLGCTVAGASPCANCSASKSHTTWPCALRTWPLGLAMRPRRASSKLAGAFTSSVPRDAVWRARVAAVASCRTSATWARVAGARPSRSGKASAASVGRFRMEVLNLFEMEKASSAQFICAGSYQN